MRIGEVGLDDAFMKVNPCYRQVSSSKLNVLNSAEFTAEMHSKGRNKWCHLQALVTR